MSSEKTVQEANEILTNAGLVLKIEEKIDDGAQAVAYAQDPGADAVVNKGDSVKVNFKVLENQQQ